MWLILVTTVLIASKAAVDARAVIDSTTQEDNDSSFVYSTRILIKVVPVFVFVCVLIYIICCIKNERDDDIKHRCSACFTTIRQSIGFRSCCCCNGDIKCRCSACCTTIRKSKGSRSCRCCNIKICNSHRTERSKNAEDRIVKFLNVEGFEIKHIIFSVNHAYEPSEDESVASKEKITVDDNKQTEDKSTASKNENEISNSMPVSQDAKKACKDVIIALCVIDSRIVSNIENEVKKIQEHKQEHTNVYVIAIHVKKDDEIKHDGTIEDINGQKVLHWDERDETDFDNNKTLKTLKEELEKLYKMFS